MRLEVMSGVPKGGGGGGKWPVLCRAMPCRAAYREGGGGVNGLCRTVPWCSYQLKEGQSWKLPLVYSTAWGGAALGRTEAILRYLFQQQWHCMHPSGLD